MIVNRAKGQNAGGGEGVLCRCAGKQKTVGFFFVFLGLLAILFAYESTECENLRCRGYSFFD